MEDRILLMERLFNILYPSIKEKNKKGCIILFDNVKWIVENNDKVGVSGQDISHLTKKSLEKFLKLNFNDMHKFITYY